MVHAVTLSASTEFRHTMEAESIPFADWCCRMEVKAEFLLSAAYRNVDSAFLLFDTTDFAAFRCAWVLVEVSTWSNVSSCFIINLTRGSVAVIEYSYSLFATRTGLKMLTLSSFDGKVMTSRRPASCSRNNVTRKDTDTLLKWLEQMGDPWCCAHEI